MPGQRIVFLTLVALILVEVDAAQVCYADVGCFQDTPPFNNVPATLPASPGKIGTKFILYKPSAKSGSGTALAYTNISSLAGSGFDVTLPLKVLVHGFTDSENKTWIIEMKNAFLDKIACNVVIVGWGPGAAAPNYAAAAVNTRLVGRQIALLIRNMQRLGLSLSRVHIVGHSLGAHVAGYAGTELGGAIGRISGLDPAAPFFEDEDVRVRLDPADASFVDVIHTNGAYILKLGFGIAMAVGHVDFYPNGGETQPGCPSSFADIALAFLTRGFEGALRSVACSHSRAITYFTESIRSTTCRFTANGCPGGYEDFNAGKCANCATYGCSEMGINADRFARRGKMFLRTGSVTPFCLPTPAQGR